MKIVELIIDEEDEFGGIDAIKSIDDEKKILMGALLIPNKTIYRKEGKEEYYIYFSKETVKKASELFLMNGKQNNATLEHKFDIEGLTLVESWIVEDKEKDKTALYGMDVPVGTWMGAVKVNNEEIWNDFVKSGDVKGFSIEGFFLDKEERPKEKIKDNLSSEIKAGINLLKLKELLIKNANYASKKKN